MNIFESILLTLALLSVLVGLLGLATWLHHDRPREIPRSHLDQFAPPWS